MLTPTNPNPDLALSSDLPPGFNCGRVDQPIDWRKNAKQALDEDPVSMPASPALIAMFGFDPDEIFADEEGGGQ